MCWYCGRTTSGADRAAVAEFSQPYYAVATGLAADRYRDTGGCMVESCADFARFKPSEASCSSGTCCPDCTVNSCSAATEEPDARFSSKFEHQGLPFVTLDQDYLQVTLSNRYIGNSSIATRTWVILSRSRTVTVLSSSVWKSTVTQYGVPISSWRR
jgi:hypothetical protein